MAYKDFMSADNECLNEDARNALARYAVGNFSRIKPENKTLRVTIPRMCDKRLSIKLAALEKVKEGYTVVINDLGACEVTTIKPEGVKNNESKN